MTERWRVPVAAAAAFLLGGAPLPFLGAFLGFERARRRAPVGGDAAFLLGAAGALLYSGVYLKDLHDATSLAGIGWFGSLNVAFEAGMLAVLALHAVHALRPRPDGTEAAGPNRDAAELAALSVILAAGFIGWVVDASTGRLRDERLLGPSWLVADLILAGAAVALIRRAFATGDEAPAGRDPWALSVCAFSAWLIGAQVCVRFAGEWLSPSSLLALAAWSGACVFALREARLRASPSGPEALSRLALAAAAWRVLGIAISFVASGYSDAAPSTFVALAAFFEVPARLAFCWVFLSSGLAV